MTKTKVVTTPHWTLRVPSEGPHQGVICIPTVHPIGDRRVVRCAQAALDAGYGIHLMWLGGEPGTTHWANAIAETRLPEPSSTAARLRTLWPIFSKIRDSRFTALHIHDFYMLPFAAAWKARHRKIVLYDVHEYYPKYYSSMVRGRALQKLVEVGVGAIEITLARYLGYANVVSEDLARRFSRRGVSTSVTPNYPLYEPFYRAKRDLSRVHLRRVIHTGTLTDDYGAPVLLEVAAELWRRHPAIEIVAVGRFPSESARQRFYALRDKKGAPPNLTLVPPRPAHEVPELLASGGIGISLMQDVGQNSSAIPSKLYEYALAGMVVVGPELPGHRRFLERHGAGLLVAPSDAIAYADAIISVAENGDALVRKANAARDRATAELTWENGSSSSLTKLLDSFQVCSDEMQGRVV